MRSVYSRNQPKEEIMRTVIKTYRHKKNHNKYIEVHSDGYGHYSVVQYMYWAKTNVKNKTGDRRLHRWRKSSLQILLESYDLYAVV